MLLRNLQISLGKINSSNLSCFLHAQVENQTFSIVPTPSIIQWMLAREVHTHVLTRTCTIHVLLVRCDVIREGGL